MTEATWTAALLKKVRLRFPTAFVQKLNLRIGAGIPDAVIVLNGHTVWVEFKGPKTTITPLQKITMKKIHGAGARVIVVRFTGRGLEHTIHSCIDTKVFTDNLLISYLEATCQ